MKITLAGIEFDDLREFTKFVNDLDLLGIVQLRESIRDKKGNILIKDNVHIKESALKKLESLSGQYESKFKVNMTSDVTGRIKKALTAEIMPGIQKSKNEFISILYNNDQSSVVSTESLINSSFYTNDLVLVLYKIMLEQYDFFQHIVSMGLICLGTVVQRSYNIKLIHRYAFLTGMFSDVIFFNTDYWRKSNLDDTLMERLAKLNAQIAQNVNMPAQIVSAIQNHIVKGVYVVDKPDPMDFNVLNANPFLESVPRETGGGDDYGLVDNEYFEETVKILTESLKITRFISETYKRISGGDNVAEKLLVMFCYNVEKGIFDKGISNPMIERFREYEKIVARTRKIAELENRCIHIPSAWAYPKPKATQILCKNKVLECPNYVSGWDINVVTAQEAVGYVGTALKPGAYPKCKLEKELTELKG
ncbi:MAG TPA: hypothetical protein PK079_21450 [Leptospiraceae bacterium]|nr:hypothetical protein [Leptospiraceae bacterium]HMW03655.1 hypothetical protein [Leptospiraceae bacterium]HMX31218.1 hypothetical protein [Leptospiraceae bacterium]HMY29424.1 hypothetical protein [Leptospiraceae bacterium]HMZ65834.1 hypothetical protein [Leptospiraceae bacterium]